MATYISASDITDSVILDFTSSGKLAAKITKSDDAVEDMALSKGVEDTDIETSPVHYLVKEWAIAWVGREICFDAMGRNNIELPEIEKYKIKYDLYVERVADLEKKINVKVLTGTDETEADRASTMTVNLYRG